MRIELIKKTHDPHVTDNQGHNITLATLKRTFFSLSQYAFVRRFVRNCYTCSRSKTWRKKSQGLLRPLPILDRFYCESSVDFMTELPGVNHREPRYLMVIYDCLLKAINLEVMISMEAEVSAKSFVQCH